MEVDPFAAGFANDAFAFVSGEFLGRQIRPSPIASVNKIVVRHLAVGQHLLLILVFNFRMHLAGQRL
jgi:CDP-diglyceride synthetase